jgi:predicted TIM-barrel fold metal-dependent hydrolase
VKVNRWIDVHAHFSPPASREELHERWQAARAACFLVPEPHVWDVDRTLAYMDRAGMAMQLLSNLPRTHAALRASNDFGRQLVTAHPSRFGLLTALPTDDAEAALAEIARVPGDGFAVTATYNGVALGDPALDLMWAELDRRRASVFAHPFAYAPAVQGRPAPLIEVAFETARTVVDMLYTGWFRRFPHVKLVLAHCGGALPALTGRLIALGTEVWVPNPIGLTPDEIRDSLRGLYLDTAAMATPHALAPALAMTTCDHLVYGSDCGVPCTNERTLAANLTSLHAFDGLTAAQIEAIGHTARRLFPSAAARADQPDYPSVVSGTGS